MALMMVRPQDPRLVRRATSETARRAQPVRAQKSRDANSAPLVVRHHDSTWHKHLPELKASNPAERQNIEHFCCYYISLFYTLIILRGGPDEATRASCFKTNEKHRHENGHHEGLLKPRPAERNELKTHRPDHKPTANLAKRLQLTSAQGHREQTLQYQKVLLLMLAAASLACVHNAPSCSGFSYTERDHNLGLVGNNHVSSI